MSEKINNFTNDLLPTIFETDQTILMIAEYSVKKTLTKGDQHESYRT